MGLRERPGAVGGGERVQRRCVERVREVVVRVDHQLGEQRVAVLEVAVQRGAGDADSLAIALIDTRPGPPSANWRSATRSSGWPYRVCASIGMVILSNIS